MNQLTPSENHLSAEDHIDEFKSTLPTSILKYYKAIPDEVLNMPEEKLEKHIPGDELTSIQHIRAAFWLEFNRAKTTLKPISLLAVYGGICTKNFFLNHIISNSFKASYIFKPPVAYEVMLDDLLYQGLRSQRQILMMPDRDDKGVFNKDLVKIKTAIIENIHNRVKGLPVSRSEIKNFTISAPPQQKLSSEELKAKIRELEKETGVRTINADSEDND